MNVAVIDYGAGNLRSVANALRSLGVEPRIVADPPTIDGCQPPDPARRRRLRRLHARNSTSRGFCRARPRVDRRRPAVPRHLPRLPVAVRSQRGVSRRPPASASSPAASSASSDQGLKIPHMGWNAAVPTRPADPRWQGLGAEPYFYFVHSYFPRPDDPDLVAARHRLWRALRQRHPARPPRSPPSSTRKKARPPACG